MDAIRIENLRSLADTGFIELKPITLLLGENNSGKSTFLRTFPLLRQSVEVKTAGPILWYGQLVDFGSFQEVLNRAAKKSEIDAEGYAPRRRLSVDSLCYDEGFRRFKIWFVFTVVIALLPIIFNGILSIFFVESNISLSSVLA